MRDSRIVYDIASLTCHSVLTFSNEFMINTETDQDLYQTTNRESERISVGYPLRYEKERQRQKKRDISRTR